MEINNVYTPTAANENGSFHVFADDWKNLRGSYKTGDVYIDEYRFDELWNYLLLKETSASKQEILAGSLTKMMPAASKKFLIKRAREADRNGFHHVAAAIYEELGFEGSAVYCRGKAASGTADTSRQEMIIYQYYMRRGRRAKALNHLLDAARSAAAWEKPVLYKELVLRLNDSNWDDSYKNMIRVKWRVAEARSILASCGIEATEKMVADELKRRLSVKNLATVSVQTIKETARVWLTELEWGREKAAVSTADNI